MPELPGSAIHPCGCSVRTPRDVGCSAWTLRDSGRLGGPIL